MKLLLKELKEKDQIVIEKEHCTFSIEMETTYPIRTGQQSNKTKKKVNIIIAKQCNLNSKKCNLSSWTKTRCITPTTKPTSYIRTVAFNLRLEGSL